MKEKIELSLFLTFTVFVTITADFNPFSDNVFFSINWPGATDDLGDSLSDPQSIIVSTVENEKYRCIIPSSLEDDEKERKVKEYTGLSEMELLKPLFQQTSCSYRIESYWTYELCHGRYLRQYHEEKDSKKSSLQEYFLGRYLEPHVTETESKEGSPTEPDADSNKKYEHRRVKTRKIDGVEYPYFEVPFTGGTKCDLTETPRKATMQYICQPQGRGEIYELKEVSTCEYEVVVLTSHLCTHPIYEQRKDPVNRIQCLAMDGSPRRPKSLDSLELENTRGRYNRKQDYRIYENEEVAYYDGDDEPEDTETTDDKSTISKPPPTRPPAAISARADKKLLQEFLQGDYCISGGTGWWKHEFCYGRKVIQYHEEKDSRTVITLGVWQKNVHLKWLNDNPSKRPKPVAQRRSVSQFYTGGDFCDLSKKERQVEVKLKCKDNPNQPHAMAIYLVEPNSCEYVLVVESQIFCSLISQADDDGMIPTPEL